MKYPDEAVENLIAEVRAEHRRHNATDPLQVPIGNCDRDLCRAAFHLIVEALDPNPNSVKEGE